MDCFRDTHRSPLIPIGKKKPSGLNKKQEEIVHRELQRVVTALGIRFGEMNIEILLDEDDNVHFLELGSRAGGNMIPIQLSDAFGIDLVKANVQAAIGVKPDFVDEQVKALPGCYMHYVLHSYMTGTFDSIEIAESIKNFVYREVIYKKPGDKVEFFDGAGKALGIVFLHFDTFDEMELFCQNHDSFIKVKLQ